MLNALASASRAASVLTSASGSAVSPSTRKMHQADAERRPGRPEHVADVLPDGEPAADELGDQDRGLRQRRHLVAEVGAADDGAGRDRLVEAHDVRHADERDAERPAVVHELPVTMPTRAQIAAVGEVEPRRADQPDAVVDDGRDGAGHVPGADQRADREQDEDRAHRGRHAADGRVGDRRPTV